MKQLFFAIFLFFFLINNSHAQDKCQVMPDELKGTYSGECLHGKANGKGSATGVDIYEGLFLNGYPEGKGMYTWKDGHYYIGQFKKGKLDGAGNMYFESAKGEDSVINGFWKKDKYIGLYENPYQVNSTTTRINKVDCRIIKKGGSGSIIINTTQMSAFAGGVGIPTISSMSVLSGQYLNKTNSAITNISITRLMQMEFPFRAIFYYSNGEYFEVEFNEQADYDVTVNLM